MSIVEEHDMVPGVLVQQVLEKCPKLLIVSTQTCQQRILRVFLAESSVHSSGSEDWDVPDAGEAANWRENIRTHRTKEEVWPVREWS